MKNSKNKKIFKSVLVLVIDSGSEDDGGDSGSGGHKRMVWEMVLRMIENSAIFS